MLDRWRIGDEPAVRHHRLTVNAQQRRAATSATAMAAFLAGMGALHFVRPEPFDGIIPAALPGSPRAYTCGSGVAELGTAALLAVPATRRLGGRIATVLFVAVFPGNVEMAWQWRHRPWQQQIVSLGRLPLQALLIEQSEHIHDHA